MTDSEYFNFVDRSSTAVSIALRMRWRAKERIVDTFSILIPDADEGFSFPVAYCLKTAGQRVHGLSRSRWKISPLSNLFETLEYSTQGSELNSWLKCIDEVVVRRKIDAILPVSSHAIRNLSNNRHRLASADKLVQLPSPSVFDTATNKASLANFLAVHGLPQPPTVVWEPGVPAAEKTSALNFPVLVKPALARGGSGIRRFQDMKSLEMFLAIHGKETQWIVQEFVPGTDLCVNVLCQDGKIIASTVQHAIVPSSDQYAPNAGFEFRSDPSAIDVARRVVEKLGWSGIANFDMRFDAQNKAIVMLEINGRYWLSMLGSFHAGVNFPLLACESVLGPLKSNRQPRETRYFSGKLNAIRSLLGGGRDRLKPHETDLRYFAYDPVRLVSVPIFKLARTVYERPLILGTQEGRTDRRSESIETAFGGDF